jgi:hypothetical protein
MVLMGFGADGFSVRHSNDFDATRRACNIRAVSSSTPRPERGNRETVRAARIVLWLAFVAAFAFLYVKRGSAWGPAASCSAYSSARGAICALYIFAGRGLWNYGRELLGL